MNLKARLKGKKEEVKERIENKLKTDEKKDGETAATPAKAAVVVGVATALMVFLCGCQSLIPSARSNTTHYGDIVKVEAGGYVGSINVTIGDGTLASADGGGDSQSNTPTQTVSPQTQLSYGIGTGGGSTWGEFFGSLSKLFTGSGSTTATAATTAATAATSKAAATGACADGSCQEK